MEIINSNAQFNRSKIMTSTINGRSVKVPKKKKEKKEKFNPYKRKAYPYEIKSPSGDVIEVGEYTRPYFFECIGKATITKNISSEMAAALMSFPATPYEVIVEGN